MGVGDCEESFPISDNHQPWLMKLDGEIDKQEFMDPYNHCTVERNIPQFKGKLCLGSFENWLLLADVSTKKAFFLHRSLDSKLRVHLPPLHGVSFECLGGCVISASPNSLRCMVTFVGRGRNVIFYCRPKFDKRWTTVSLSINSDNPRHKFTGQVVRFKGKIYIVHGSIVAHRVVVINEESLLGGDCRWTTIQMPHRIAGWHHLVASGPDIFSVLVATNSFRRGFPAFCSIHRLETSDQTWERVESINGRAFFLGGIKSSALPAAQAGALRDCICVLNQNYRILHGEGVYKICMQDKTVNLTLLLQRPEDGICKLCWLMPTRMNQYAILCLFISTLCFFTLFLLLLYSSRYSY